MSHTGGVARLNGGLLPNHSGDILTSKLFDVKTFLMATGAAAAIVGTKLGTERGKREARVGLRRQGGLRSVRSVILTFGVFDRFGRFGFLLGGALAPPRLPSESRFADTATAGLYAYGPGRTCTAWP